MLPFTSEAPSPLYEIARPFLVNIGIISSLGDSATITFAYILIISFILLLIAGFVSIFPLDTGVLGVIGMGLITIFPHTDGNTAASLESRVLCDMGCLDNLAGRLILAW